MFETRIRGFYFFTNDELNEMVILLSTVSVLYVSLCAYCLSIYTVFYNMVFIIVF